MEGELAVLISRSRAHRPLKFCHLFAQHLFALGKIRFVEQNESSAHSRAHSYVWLLTFII